METNNKLREAAVKALVSEIGDYSADGLKVVWCGISGNTIKMLRAALAEPVKNCEVGTAEEQAKRMDAYCARNGERIDGGWRCDNCPLCSINRCELAWAQMPYEEGGAK